MGRLSGVRALPGAYWKLWAASVVSNLGDGISVLAYPWLASLLTRDPVLISGVAFATRVPWLVLSLPVGAVVDRSDRRRLMVVANTFRFAITLAVAAAVVLDMMTIPILYAAAVLLGCAEVVYDNAAQTILPSLVPPERLERANGTMYGAEMIMNELAGPPIGGFLIGLALAAPFMVDSATFGISALLIFLIGGAYRPRLDEAPVVEGRSIKREIGEGFRWLWRHPLLRTLALALGGLNLLGAITMATFVLFAQEILGLDATGLGIVFTASAVGGIVGSQLAPAISKKFGQGPALYACLASGIVCLPIIALTSSPVVVAASFFVYMSTGVVWNVITVSLRQTIIPDRLLGRVNSVYRFFGWGTISLGSLLGGAIVAVAGSLQGRETGLRTPFIVGALGHLVIVTLVGTRLSTRRVREALGSADEPSQR